MFKDDFLLPEEEQEAPKSAPFIDVPEVSPITAFIEGKTLSVRVPDDADRMSIAVNSTYLKVFFTDGALRAAQLPVPGGDQLVEVVVSYLGTSHQDTFRDVVKSS